VRKIKYLGIKIMTVISHEARDRLKQALIDYNNEELFNSHTMRAPLEKHIKDYIKSHTPTWEKFQHIYDKQSADWFVWIQQGKEHIINCPLFDKIIKDRTTSKYRINNWRMEWREGYYVQRQTDKRCHWSDYNEKPLSARRAWRLMLAMMDDIRDEGIEMRFPHITSDLINNSTSVDNRKIMFSEGILSYQWNNAYVKVITEADEVEQEISSMINDLHQSNNENIKV
jgi:hypothetical protein